MSNLSEKHPEIQWAGLRRYYGPKLVWLIERIKEAEIPHLLQWGITGEMILVPRSRLEEVWEILDEPIGEMQTMIDVAQICYDDLENDSIVFTNQLGRMQVPQFNEVFNSIPNRLHNALIRDLTSGLLSDEQHNQLVGAISVLNQEHGGVDFMMYNVHNADRNVKAVGIMKLGVPLEINKWSVLVSFRGQVYRYFEVPRGVVISILTELVSANLEYDLTGNQKEHSVGKLVNELLVGPGKDGDYTVDRLVGGIWQTVTPKTK